MLQLVVIGGNRSLFSSAELEIGHCDTRWYTVDEYFLQSLFFVKELRQKHFI
jgi:hypothetical protein